MGSRLEAVGEAQGPGVGLLDQVLGLGAVSRQVDGEVVEGVQVLQRLSPEVLVGARRAGDVLTPGGRRTRRGRASAVEPPAGEVRDVDRVLVLERVEQLAHGLVEHRVLELGREVGERPQHEASLVHEQVRHLELL